MDPESLRSLISREILNEISILAIFLAGMMKLIPIGISKESSDNLLCQAKLKFGEGLLESFCSALGDFRISEFHLHDHFSCHDPVIESQRRRFLLDRVFDL